MLDQYIYGTHVYKLVLILVDYFMVAKWHLVDTQHEWYITFDYMSWMAIFIIIDKQF